MTPRARSPDVSPLSDGDSRWLSVFYEAFGVVLAGSLFGLTSRQTASILGPRKVAASRWSSASLRVWSAATQQAPGILSAQYLPGWLEPLAGVLPVGVAVRALRGHAYFGGDGLGPPVGVLTLGELGSRVRVVTGSILDAETLSEAAAGCRAALTCVGSSAEFLGRGRPTCRAHQRAVNQHPKKTAIATASQAFH